MPRREQWDIHEAVILLDGLLRCQEKIITRKEAILSVSKRLRRMAENRGVNIDDIYRNVNGISFQMSSMESALAGHTIMKPATRLFAETVSIYQNDPMRFKKLLEEAEVMIRGNQMTNEEKFMTWLASKVTPAQLSELYGTYKEIEAFSLRTKVLKRPLFETLDYQTAKKVQQTIESNKAFRIFHRKNVSKCIAAASHYCKYLKELQETQATPPVAAEEKRSISEPDTSPVEELIPVPVSGQSSDLSDSEKPGVNDDIPTMPLDEKIRRALEEECNGNSYGTTVTFLQGKFPGVSAAEIKRILEQSKWATMSFGTWKYQEPHIDVPAATDTEENTAPTTATGKNEIHVVDFENIPPLVYTKPISFSYFEEATDGLRSWTDLYVKVFSALYEDYPHLLSVGASFTVNGDGRVELGDSSMVHTMVAPKAIVTTDRKPLFLETNLSANNIVGKIRFLLNLCSVDYENLVIKYSSTRAEAKTNTDRSPVQESAYWESPLLKAFVAWMLENGSAPATTRNYTGAIRSAEEYAKTHSLAHSVLFTDEHQLAVMTASDLFADEGFVAYNKRQHNRFRAAIAKLLEYYGVDSPFQRQRPVKSEPAEEQHAPKISIDAALFRAVLISKFVRGFRMGSPLDMKKFRKYYEAETGQALSMQDDAIEQAIRACGIEYNEKVFVPDAMLPAELREKLFDTIRESFAEGKNAVYFEALFRSFSESFLDYYVYDAEMLKAYIAFYNNGEFHISNKYLSKDAVTEVNPLEEVKAYLVTAGRPIETEEICETLSHIPSRKVMQILGMNSEFVHNGRSNGKGYYFHVSVVHLTDEDLENISALIEDAIADKTFVSGNELVEMIEARYPYILESNPLISMMGMRDALKYHLGSRFSFKGNIISAPDRAISMADVFGNYARTHTTFTMTELKNLAVEMNSTVYFDAVYDNSLRISKEQFVSKDYAQFRVEDTDRAIARFCTSAFMPIGNIRELGTFPDAGYPWTTFLLEHFVYSYSRQFKLLHAGFNRECSVGAIVRRDAGIESFTNLLSIALGESEMPIKKDKALSFFVEKGYLARRNYSDIEKVLIQANTHRNRKGTK